MPNIVEYILQLRDEQFRRGIQDAKTSTDGLNNSFNNLLSAVGVSLSVAGLAQFTRSVVDAGVTVENARIGLSALLQDSAKASQVISNSLKDSSITGLNFETVLKGQQMLISSRESAEDAREAILSIANALRLSGGGSEELMRILVNMQQIKNLGHAQGVDLKQFEYARINIYQALQDAGIRYKKATEVTYDQIVYALKKASEEGGLYYGGLQAMADATSTHMNQLGNEFYAFKAALFDSLKPALEGTITNLKSLVGWLSDHRGTIIETSKALVLVGTAILGIKTASALATPIIALMGGTLSATPWGAIAIAIGGVATVIGMIAGSAEDAKNRINGLRQAQKDIEEENLNKQLDAALKASGSKNKEALTDKIVRQEYDRLDAEEKRLSRGLDKARIKQDNSGHWYDMFFVNPANTTLTPEEQAVQNHLDALNKNNAAKQLLNQWSANQKNKPITKAGLTPTPNASSTGDTPKTISKPRANKAVTINVQIKEFGKITLNTTNIRESASKIQEYITTALTNAINDFQIVAEHQ